MLKTTLFLISFLLIAQATTAQLPAPTTQWSKCYGGTKYDGISCMIEAHNDGFMVVGYSEAVVNGNIDSCPNKKTWVAKLNNEGLIEWQKYYGFEDGGVYSIVKYPTGGYVLCGANGKIGGDFTDNKGMADFWVVRINDTGKIIWQKSYGGSYGESAKKVVVDKANNIYVGGMSQSFDGDVKHPHIQLPFASEEMWIIKLDPNGNLIWERSYGGTGDDALNGLVLTPDNNLIFCGRTMSTNGDVVGNHTPSLGYLPLDAWVVKIDTSGAILWQRPCGGSIGEEFRDVAIAADSGCILVGSTTSYDGDVSGYHHTPDSLKQGPSGFVDVWIVKLDKYGKLEWQKCLGGSLIDWAFTVNTDKEGNYIVQANSTSKDGDLPVGEYRKRSYLLKLNKQGEIVWKRFIGGTSDNSFYNIIIDKANNIYGAGRTYSNDFDASTTNDVDSLGLQGDGWIMKFYPEIVPIKVVANNNTLNIYPNPASTAVYIATQNIKEIRFIDVLGRVYFNKKIDNTNNAGFTYFPLNYIANGTYMVQAITKEGEVKTGKLVVVK
jgi:Secretion system C-terminal sorting domain